MSKKEIILDTIFIFFLIVTISYIVILSKYKFDDTFRLNKDTFSTLKYNGTYYVEELYADAKIESIQELNNKYIITIEALDKNLPEYTKKYLDLEGFENYKIGDNIILHREVYYDKNRYRIDVKDFLLKSKEDICETKKLYK